MILQPSTRTTPVERKADKGAGQVPVTVRIEYFALFRSHAKASSEEITTSSGNVMGLYEMLREKYRFPLDRDSVHAVVNEEYADWDRELRSGDTVVFMPPISGG